MLHGSEPGVCRKEQRSESSSCEVRCHGATLASPSGRWVSGLVAGGEGPPVVLAWPLRRLPQVSTPVLETREVESSKTTKGSTGQNC